MSEQVKSQFPTEIIDLPSKGKLYPKEHPFSSGKVEMRYMTAKEEDILTSQTLLRKGIAFDKVLESLIVEKIDLNSLLLGDKNALMIAARVLGYGKEYKVEVDDPFSPGTKQKETIDLTQFTNKEYDGSNQVELNKNEFEFELPNSKRKITFMAMTESRERKVKHQVEAQKKANRKLKDMTSRELTTRMKNMILSVDGSDEQKDINHFVDNELFAVDSKALRAYINQSIPDIDLTFEFVSEETGEEREMQLPMDVGFFWPSE